MTTAEASATERMAALVADVRASRWENSGTLAVSPFEHVMACIGVAVFVLVAVGMCMVGVIR